MPVVQPVPAIRPEADREARSYITASSISGTGTVTANGGAYEVGGGGRIAVYYDSVYWTGQMTANGGAGSHASGSSGTVYTAERPERKGPR